MSNGCASGAVSGTFVVFGTLRGGAAVPDGGGEEDLVRGLAIGNAGGDKRGDAVLARGADFGEGVPSGEP